MKIGMTLPVTEPGWRRDIFLQWAEKIDSGPYDSLALGERICFPSPELFTTLGACAAVTRRVRLVSTVLILPMHDPVLTAKQLATIDMLSDGRLTVGVGTGGRDEDYLATGVPLSHKRLARLESYIETMRAVWAGDIVVEGTLRPVEPAPVQGAALPLLAGAMGPRSMANAARWADGISGMTVVADAADARGSFDMAEQAWADAGRGKPLLNTAFWFALGPEPDAQMQTHLQRYFNWLDPASRDGMVAAGGFRGDARALADRLRAFADVGTDELLLIPTTIDPAEVDRASEAIAML